MLWSALMGTLTVRESPQEPWTQIIAAPLSPEGLLVAICSTPSFHGTRDS
jgi:hypothetical protein